MAGFVWVVVGSGMYLEGGEDLEFSSKREAERVASLMRFGRAWVSVEKREVENV